MAKKFAPPAEPSAPIGGVMHGIPDPFSAVSVKPAEQAAEHPGGKSVEASAPARSTAATVGQIYEMHVDLVDENPYNERVVYPEADLLELANDMLQEGQRVPALVVPNPDNPSRKVLLTGHRRRRSIKRFDINHGRIMLMDHPGEYSTWIDVIQAASRLNNTEKSRFDVDKGLAWARAIKDTGLSIEAFSEKIGMGRSVTHRFLAFDKLPEEVLEVVYQHPEKITARVAGVLLTLSNRLGGKITADLATRYAAEELTLRQLEQRISNDSTSQVQRRTRESASATRDSGCGKVKLFEESGLIKAELTVMDPAIRARVFDAINKAIAESLGNDAEN